MMEWENEFVGHFWVGAHGIFRVSRQKMSKSL